MDPRDERPTFAWLGVIIVLSLAVWIAFILALAWVGGVWR